VVGNICYVEELPAVKPGDRKITKLPGALSPFTYGQKKLPVWTIFLYPFPIPVGYIEIPFIIRIKDNIVAEHVIFVTLDGPNRKLLFEYDSLFFSIRRCRMLGIRNNFNLRFLWRLRGKYKTLMTEANGAN